VWSGDLAWELALLPDANGSRDLLRLEVSSVPEAPSLPLIGTALLRLVARWRRDGGPCTAVVT
jgi:hypothetical protein